MSYEIRCIRHFNENEVGTWGTFSIEQAAMKASAKRMKLPFRGGPVNRSVLADLMPGESMIAHGCFRMMFVIKNVGNIPAE